MEKALNCSYAYLRICPRSVAEVRQFLRKKAGNLGFSAEDIESTITRLIELKYLDDRAFVRWFVEQRQRIKPRSRRHLIAELKRRGVTGAPVEEYFTETAVDDTRSALDLISRKSRMFERFEPAEKRRKIMNFLSRRGFSYETIKKTIARIDGEE